MQQRTRINITRPLISTQKRTPERRKKKKCSKQNMVNNEKRERTRRPKRETKVLETKQENTGKKVHKRK